jgi:aarF domain-containing kinase
MLRLSQLSKGYLKLNNQLNYSQFTRIKKFPSYKQNYRYNSSSSSSSTLNSKSQLEEIWKAERLAYLALLSGLGFGAYYYRKDIKFYSLAVLRSTLAGFYGVVAVADYKMNYPPEDPPNATAEEIAELVRKRNEVDLRNAKRVLKVFQFNGGVYIKFGQHISALGYCLPSEWTETMRPLHDRCPYTDLEDIEQMFHQDLGHSINDLFSEFNPEPIGVASLAQVHSGILRSNGKKVAIKLQHPELQRFAKLDISTVTLIVKFIKWAAPKFQFDWLAHEMATNLPVELDFRKEGENAMKTRKNFEPYPDIPLVIPEVYWSHPRVLCMEFIEGAKTDNREYLKKHGINPDEVAHQITRIFSQMIYRDGWVHCDAHPGNMLIRANPKRPQLPFDVILLDHGLYQNLTPEFRIQYARLWTSIINRKPEDIKKYSIQLGGSESAYQIIACILTGRSWEAISDKGTMDIPQTDEERKQISVSLFYLLPDIATLLSKIPRELLFCFKTQDLLRLCAQDLGAHQSQGSQLMIMARYCARTIFNDDRAKALQRSNSFIQKFANLMLVRLEYWNTVFKISLIRWYLSIQDYWKAIAEQA